MANFLVLILSFAAGLALRATGKLKDGAAAGFNVVIITICLPAVALKYLHGGALLSGTGRAALFPILMPWLFFAFTSAVFALSTRVFGWSRGTLGALLLTGGFGNTSFVGFPLIEALYGAQALSIAVLVDQPGSFLALSTIGIAAVSFCLPKKSSDTGKVPAESAWRPALRRILLFPPFLALLAALALRSVEFPSWVNDALDRLASPLTPLAMISVGAQLRLDRKAVRTRLGPLTTGLFVKLVLGPAAMCAIAVAQGLPLRGESTRITLIEATMAPMITGAILSEELGLDAELANLMVAIGIPISLATVPLWARLIG